MWNVGLPQALSQQLRVQANKTNDNQVRNPRFSAVEAKSNTFRLLDPMPPDNLIGLIARPFHQVLFGFWKQDLQQQLAQQKAHSWLA